MTMTMIFGNGLLVWCQWFDAFSFKSLQLTNVFLTFSVTGLK